MFNNNSTTVFQICDHLTEFVVLCDHDAQIRYANPAAQRWMDRPLTGHPFHTFVSIDSQQKAQFFLDAVRAASAERPTVPWELALGDPTNYTVANFWGYCENENLFIIGQTESEQMSAMHQEMLMLTSELAEAQRVQQRQNRALQQSLDEQRKLLQTIQELTAPAVPVWHGVLLLSIVGHLDSRRAHSITEQLLQDVFTSRARYVIIEISAIAVVDTAVAQHLVYAARSLRLLGAEAILVGISPEIAQTIVQLGLHLHEFRVQRNLQDALAYVLHRIS